jgi:hypothetical protein
MLKSAETNERGEFSFEDSPPGHYFLKMEGTWIPVMVDKAAVADHIDLGVAWTGCGLWFTDLSKCMRTELRIRQLSGQVIDPAGAPIPNSAIHLLDSAGNSVEELHSDEAGNFASPRAPAGSYELFVKTPGFTPMRTTVHIDPRSAVPSELTVRLGLGGSCSSLSSQSH